MNYVLVENGRLIQVGLPKTWKLPNGTVVENFDQLDPSVLKQFGWLPLDDPGPSSEIDPAKKRLNEVTTTILPDKVVVRYHFVDREAPIKEQFDALVAVLVSKRIITQDDVEAFKKPKHSPTPPTPPQPPTPPTPPAPEPVRPIR